MATPRYSPVWAVSLTVSLLLLIAGLVVTFGDRTPRLTVMRVVGLLLGVWVIGQLVIKGSVCVLAWEVKGPVAFFLAGLGVLLGGVSAYALVTSLMQ
jgi:hypothetical protein